MIKILPLEVINKGPSGFKCAAASFILEELIGFWFGCRDLQPKLALPVVVNAARFRLFCLKNLTGIEARSRKLENRIVWH